MPDGRNLNSFKTLWMRKAESRETQEIKSNNCRICVVGIIKITLYQPGVRVTLFLFWTFETAGKITGGFQSIPSLAVPEISRHQWDSVMMEFWKTNSHHWKGEKSEDIWRFLKICSHTTWRTRGDPLLPVQVIVWGWRRWPQSQSDRSNISSTWPLPHSTQVWLSVYRPGTWMLQRML